jgi:hypothetical protein
VVKTPSAARPCRLWKGYFDQFVNLAVYPTAEELSLVHLDLVKFKAKLKTAGLAEEYERVGGNMKSSLTTIRLNAQTMATAQFAFRLARASDECMTRIAGKLHGTGADSFTDKDLFQVQENACGQAMAAWTQYSLSFAAADAAARSVHADVQFLRKLAVRMLFGANCPDKVAQGIIQLPIQKGALFGPRMTAEIQQLASHQATSSLVSSALVAMGGSMIPPVTKQSSASQSKRGTAKGGRFRGGKPKGGHRGGQSGQSRGGKTQGGQSGQSHGGSGGKPAGNQGYQQGRGRGNRGGKSQRFRGGRGGGRGRGRGGGGEAGKD